MRRLGATIPAAGGTHTVCVYAVNTGRGASQELGCRRVVFPPLGPDIREGYDYAALADDERGSLNAAAGANLNPVGSSPPAHRGGRTGNRRSLAPLNRTRHFRVLTF